MEFTAGESGDRREATQPSHKTAFTERVLLVDDDPSVTHLLGRLLRRKGFVVREENDSRLALQAAREFLPGVVVLDYQMPVLDGADVAWALAGDPVCRTARLIICSAMPRILFAAKLPPYVPSFEKPVPLDDLLALIRGEQS